MQDNNLQIYTKMYCVNTKELPTITLNNNETYKEALERNKYKWTYEILNDINIFENKRVITVRVYLANEIRTGRYVYTENEASQAHYLAIEDALSQMFIFNCLQEEKTLKETQIPVANTEAPVESTQQTVQPLSQEEILNMVMQQNTPITTVEQFNNDNREEIPFEEFQLPESELDKMLSGNAQTPVETTPEPQQAPTQFTQEQIQRINNFKQKFNIKTDEEFGKFVNSWDKKYSNKRDITPVNIESFLKHVESLGEFPG